MIFKKISSSLNLSEGSVTHAGLNENRQSQHRHVEKTPSKMPNDEGGGSLESAFMYKIPSIKISKADGNIWKVIQDRPLDQAALAMEEFLGFPEKESNTFTRFDAANKNEFSSLKVQTLLETSVLGKKVLPSENIKKQSSKLISNFERISSTSHVHNVQSPSSRHLRERPARETLTEFYGSDFCDIKIPINVALKRCVVALERVPSLPPEDRGIVTQVFDTFNTKPISSKSDKSSSYGLCDKSVMSEFNSVTRPKHTVSLFKLSNKSERINLGEKPMSFKQSIPLPLSSENSAQQSNKDSNILFKDTFPFLNLSEKLVTDAGFTDSRQSQNIEKSKCTPSIIPEDISSIKSPCVYKIPSITISKAEDNIWRVLQDRPSDSAVSGMESNNYEEYYDVASINEVSFERVPKVLAALGLGRKVVPRENIEERSLKLTSTLDNEASNEGKESHGQSASRNLYERSNRDSRTEYCRNIKTPNEITSLSKRKSDSSLSKKATYLERRNSSKIKSALEMQNMNPKTSKIINDSKLDREMDEILATMFFWRA
ncbi:unnamed protein product [Bemisia tabaci]|uniref:Uncharacterized protein n=1 Tax=Bemisia tabaci TaxID=7038 RepID=A0A9P0AJU4_BEMTA|nr:PREDICTED: uncharacterized protein LOC109029703 [Bemisia tabaci]XP_018895832.1 PREDICTED: uncharacterized protein LOC109029703 [Bemisia tabaci]CAH0393071.1 unnamed protein product [Bemisia tabaci]